MTDQSRRTVTLAAGFGIILLAVGAVLLPLQEDIPGRLVVGWLLIAAGGIELPATMLRRRHRKTASLAAIATILPGARLVVDPSASFLEVLNLVILWLVVRGAALLYGAARTGGALGPWVGLAAATDLLLALALLAGLPVAVLVYGLFGPTSQVIANFAWVFAASFIATGLLLIAIARIGEPPARSPGGEAESLEPPLTPRV